MSPVAFTLWRASLNCSPLCHYFLQFLTAVNLFHFPYPHLPSQNLLPIRHAICNISYWTVYCVVSWVIFTSHAVFWQARRASQNTRDELKYPMTLHSKPLSQLIRLGRLEIHVALSNLKIDVRIVARVIVLPYLVYPYFELDIELDEIYKAL